MGWLAGSLMSSIKYFKTEGGFGKFVISVEDKTTEKLVFLRDNAVFVIA